MERPDCMVNELGGTLAVRPKSIIRRTLVSLWFPESFWRGRNNGSGVLFIGVK
jgi:hypothetical protein